MQHITARTSTINAFITHAWSARGLNLRRGQSLRSTIYLTRLTFYTMRHYASAVFAVVMCLPVRPSKAGAVSKRLGELSWFVAWKLLSTHPTLCGKEISVSPKLGYFPLELCPNPGLKNFATASRSRCQQNSSSSSSTVELVDDTYTTIGKSWLFTTSRSSVIL